MFKINNIQKQGDYLVIHFTTNSGNLTAILKEDNFEEGVILNSEGEAMDTMFYASIFEMYMYKS